MTIDELNKIPFTKVSHLSMADEHITTYVNKQYGIQLSRHVPYTEYCGCSGIDETKEPYDVYWYKGNVYETYDEFVEAMKNVPFKG